MNTVTAVLFDRDGTLVEDVPYNGDPHRVRLLPGAAEAVGLVRSRGLATGVVSNQSGIGRGLLTPDAVHRVDERADALLGGLDVWLFCPHAPEAGCACRKPHPGLVLAAAARLGVTPAQCLVIGDIAADVLAARAAGAHGVLVPNAATAPAEVARFAHQSAPDVLTAVRKALAEPTAPPGPPWSPAGKTAPGRSWPSAPDRAAGAGMLPDVAAGGPVGLSGRGSAGRCSAVSGGARPFRQGAAGAGGAWAAGPDSGSCGRRRS
ncbi:HAD-IIIA family hydrolase [Streptomyces sp. NPDC046759]|uniref:D-glycero-alpha-D-manno-heptose-1,7-bisphosphate 7-phosphatase n=1 Tax=Streptomyces sp. NPDC046759 TaxID=3155019 RepID=UPI0033D3DD03